jgi:WD40 repeat protein
VNGFRSSHAVVIGINDYQHGIPRLRTAVNDAGRIAGVLETRFGYAVQRVTEDVSLGRLRTLLGESLPRAVGADDRILVYFAGHGIAMDGDDGPAGFLVPQDARPDDRRTFLPMTDLSGWLDRLPCRHLLLVLDCCFAGAFRWSSTRDLGAVPEVVHRERFDRYIRDPAWQVITSAAYDQKALDVLSGAAIGLRAPDATAGGHSPFAAAFLRALEGEADLYPRAAPGRPGGDGVITATELYLYLRGCVEDEAEGDGHLQTPGLWPLKRHDKGEYIHLVPGHELNLPPAPELSEANNPWRGLKSYDVEQAPVFFGRSEFVRKLAERVVVQPLTIVLGASGTGKSSVVKAGLLAYLRATEPAAWRILPPVRPGKSPLSALAGLVLDGENGDFGSQLGEYWTDPEALASRVGAWAASESDGRLLLVVDQFEELITLCWDESKRDQFLRLLDRALAAHPDRLRVVLTLRSDFEPQFAQTALQDQWMSSRIVVPAMTLDEYREVIEGPASVKVLYFQGKGRSQEFINRLIGDVANTPGALPLLSFTLSELYRCYLERRGDDRSLREEDYERLGGVGGSLRNRANEVYEGLPDEASRETMRRVMLRMISVEAGELARRRVQDAELVYRDPAENVRVADVLCRLIGARLVVKGTETDDQPYVEPAHDELIRGWDRLLQWARKGQEGLLLRRILTPAAEDWKREHGGLWHSNPRLSLVRRVLESPAGWLNQTESEFVERSVLKRRRVFMGTVSAVGVAFLVLSVITGVALYQRSVARTNEEIAKERERTATSRQLAALSTSERNRSFGQSLLFAVEAMRAKYTLEARDSLFKALSDRKGLVSFLYVNEKYVTNLAFSADGKMLAAALHSHDVDNGVVLWDLASARRLNEDPLPVREGRVQSIVFSPSGETLATGYSVDQANKGGVVLWDVATRRRLWENPLAVENSKVDSMAFSPDGKTLAVGQFDGAILWELGTRERPAENQLKGKEGGISHVAFTSDGRRLACLGSGGVMMWDVAMRRWLADGPLPVSGVASSMVFSSDGRFLAVGYRSIRENFFGPHNEYKRHTRTGYVELWDVARRKLLTETVLSVDEGGVDSLAFDSVGGTLVAAYSGERSGVVLWDVARRPRRTTAPFPDKALDGGGMALSRDGMTIASGCHGGVVLWEPIARDRLTGDSVDVAGAGYVNDVAYSPNGKVLAIGCKGNGILSGSRSRVVLWDLAMRKRLIQAPLELKQGDLRRVAFSPDGKAVAAGYDANGAGGVVFWDVATGKPLADIPTGAPRLTESLFQKHS